MGLYINFISGVFILLAVCSCAIQNVHNGVDLVTRLNNELIQMIFREASGHRENLLMSPFGLLSNLAMLLEGSNDKTQQELLTMLNISKNDVINLRRGFKAYCDLFLKYSTEPEAAGSFNAATLTSSFKLNSTYKDVLQKYYCANVSENSLSNETTLELSSVTGVMSHWKDYEKLAVYTFLSHQSLRPFKKRNDDVVLVPMIPQVGVFKRKQWEKSQVILIPLQAKLVDLLLIIPDRVEDVDTIIKKLTDFTLPLLVQSLPKQELEVFIPQLAIVNKKFDLTSMLMRSGIHRAFDLKKSNFTKASSQANVKPVLKKFEQNAFFSTSFVALNSVSGISAPLELHKRSKRDAHKFYVDRPFLFFIVQKDTQLVLLTGKVENPVVVPQ